MASVSYAHKRTAKRVGDAKRKARSELIECGWTPHRVVEENRIDFSTATARDTIERVCAADISVAEFIERFEKPGKPVIITGLTNNWQATTKWKIPLLYRKYRNQKFKCGEDDEGYSVKMKLKYYMDYMLGTNDDSPLYIFDSSFGDRAKVKRLLDDYEVPPMFADDLFRYATEKRRPPYRWFVMGPARSGTAIHIDPLGTSAWNALIAGHKKWCLIHPSTPKALVKPRKDERGEHPDEAITWFSTVYERVCSPTWYRDFPVVHAIQQPGDVMFVPSGWWHVVMNLDNTIAVTQNFCSLANLPQVWPKCVKSRPQYSRHWLRALQRERPEVVDRIAAISRTDDWRRVAAEVSSDSSSSSSSSDSDSDSDSGAEFDAKPAVPTHRKRRLSVRLEALAANEDVVDEALSEQLNTCVNKRRRSPQRV